MRLSARRNCAAAANKKESWELILRHCTGA